jgi:hypothetical protein
VSEVLIFVHARALARSGRRLSAALDLPMFKLQRREALRMRVQAEHEASALIGGHALLPHDISATGLSVLIPLDLENDFPRHRLIKGCEIRFAGRTLHVNLEVTSMIRAREGGKWKVGFRFRGLPANEEQAIAKIAYLHGHKVWSRWV